MNKVTAYLHGDRWFVKIGGDQIELNAADVAAARAANGTKSIPQMPGRRRPVGLLLDRVATIEHGGEKYLVIIPAPESGKGRANSMLQYMG